MTQLIARATSDSPAGAVFAVTPSDSAVLPNGTCRGLYIGVTGNIQVTSPDSGGASGEAVVFVGLPAGTILPVQVTQVWNTNTTASSIVALY
jgi:hypothetical protein